ncbi:MAG: type 1 glutamine amidotransferase [Persicimonas sp.]
MSTSQPDILLLQARQPGDAMLDHELRCFASRCGLEPAAFESVNMVDEPLGVHLLADVDAVMVGGAGEFSVAKGGFDWHQPLLDLMKLIARKQMPMFGSCFGFQAIVQAFGGRVETRPDMGEVGTYEVRLTEEGRQDPIFGAHPDRFDAQFGHNDSVIDLPDEFVWLASSKRCNYQAIRFRDAPIVATQFHPELCAEDNMQRYIAYLKNYEAGALDDQQARDKARQMHRPSPYASQLLREFVDELLG